MYNQNRLNVRDFLRNLVAVLLYKDSFTGTDHFLHMVLLCTFAVLQINPLALELHTSDPQGVPEKR